MTLEIDHSNHHVRRDFFWDPRWWFTRGLALSHLAASLSLWSQIHGLIGQQGIAPWAKKAESILLAHGGEIPWTEVPSVLWLTDMSDGVISLLSMMWVFCSMTLFCGLLPIISLLGVLTLSVSLAQISSPFLPFQWDILLHEVSLLALFYLPWVWRERWISALFNPSLYLPLTPPPSWARWGLRLLLFKLMIDSGLAKLISGDQTWTDLKALHFHFWTQPIPNGGAVFAQSLPHWMKSFGVQCTLMAEVWAPLLLIIRVRAWPLLWCISMVPLVISGGALGWGSTALFITLAVILDERLIRYGSRQLASDPNSDHEQERRGDGERFDDNTYTPEKRWVKRWMKMWRGVNRFSPEWGAILPIALLMFSISLTGNYGFFQLLVFTLLLAVLPLNHHSPTLSDHSPISIKTAGIKTSGIKTSGIKTSGSSSPLSLWMIRCLSITLTSCWLIYSLLLHTPWIGRDRLREAFIAERQQEGDGGFTYDAYRLYQSTSTVVRPWLISTRYGLFARMTTKRAELIIEGSADGVKWSAYQFHYKPNSPKDPLPWIGLHMPRLDWQMWFEALSPRCHEGWFLDLIEALFEERSAALSLFKEIPIAQPQWIRVRHVLYQPTKNGFWRENPIGFYCSAMTHQELRLGREELKVKRGSQRR